ncbi:MAG: nucleotidyltransferase domain-containing protein [Gemmatimonadetes bacterium]|nr:nucleotidyltransferase domain-containing protein [Gemmatimonadota bacterium]
MHSIVTCLLSLDPYRIVLFGSHALDREHLESDVDLLIILEFEVMSQTYEERVHKRISTKH